MFLWSKNLFLYICNSLLDQDKINLPEVLNMPLVIILFSLEYNVILGGENQKQNILVFYR